MLRRPSKHGRFDRRRFLLAGTVSGAIFLLPAVARAGVIREVGGAVRVNGRPAGNGGQVMPGDIVETGAASRALLAIGGDAFLLREQTRLELYGAKRVPAGTVSGFHLADGGVLAALGPGLKEVVTTTATARLHGTAVYVEARPERTYFCTCYGDAQLMDQHRHERVDVATRYHRAHLVHAWPHAGRYIELVRLANHSDDELTMLEALVGRRPPFLR